MQNDFTLQVGSFTTEVSVSAAASHTDDASLTQIIPNETMTELPVTGHDALKVAITTAGVTLAGDTAVGDPPGEDFHGPGTRGVSNNVRLDGVTLMNTIHGAANFKPSPDAVQELSVQVGTYSAEYGGYMGVHINAVSKTGGNKFRGVFSEALRNDMFDARDYFDAPDAPKNPLSKNQFSAELDGPVIRNKTFFMVNYQGQRQSATNTNIATVMTEKMRQGDFSEVLSRVRLADPVDRELHRQQRHPAPLYSSLCCSAVELHGAAAEPAGRGREQPTAHRRREQLEPVHDTHRSHVQCKRAPVRPLWVRKAKASTGAVLVPGHVLHAQHTTQLGGRAYSGDHQQPGQPIPSGRNTVSLNSANG